VGQFNLFLFFFLHKQIFFDPFLREAGAEFCRANSFFFARLFPSIRMSLILSSTQLFLFF